MANSATIVFGRGHIHPYMSTFALAHRVRLASSARVAEAVQVCWLVNSLVVKANSAALLLGLFE